MKCKVCDLDLPDGWDLVLGMCRDCLKDCDCCGLEKL